jgi:CHAT domain-containing protein
MSKTTDPNATKLAINTILRRKGRVLDAMANSIGSLRQRSNSEDRLLLDQLANAQTAYSMAVLNGPGKAEPRDYQQQLQSLFEKVEQLEGKIGERSAEFRNLSRSASVEQVQEAIPAGDALVEFVLFRPYDPQTDSFGEPHYIAYVLSHSEPVRSVELGETKPIDSMVATLRKELRDPKTTNLHSLARSLDEKVMRPVRMLLGQNHTILLSPDGELNLIPFGALIDENKHYLVESYSFTYLTSGRDLLRLQHSSNLQVSEPVIVANPLFDMTTSPGAATGSAPDESTKITEIGRRSVDFAALNYKPLPGTAAEAAALQLLFPFARVLTEEKATEAAMKKVNSPQILHVATHGFFLTNQAQQAEKQDRRAFSSKSIDPSGRENPLLRSGLIMAGVKQQSSGENEDGVLTALEVAGMNLSGTKLVVLSACETGLGDLNRGEGVYGLRRALVLAGSESQMISLWKVADVGTRDLMTAYYTRLQAGEGRTEALRQVQLAMLRGRLTPGSAVRDRARETGDTRLKPATKDYRHPYYWAAFIPSGDWRSIEGK